MFKKIESKISELCHFLEVSPTAWHAVDFMVKKLIEAGFEILDEKKLWKLQPGKSYAFVKNGSSLCAFVVPSQKPESIHLVGSHTDSPALKLKPHAEFLKENMLMLGVEVYGAPLLSSWLNRDLGIAGRVFYKDVKNKLQEALVNFNNFPLVLPQLAIHLDRNVNENGVILNKQEHLAVLADLQEANFAEKKKESSYLKTLLFTELQYKTLLSYDLFLYPLEKPRLLGTSGEMVSSYRIDNLASAHAALTGIIQAKKPHKNILKMAAFWDNEEVGSQTPQGANSPFIAQTIERICLSLNINRESYFTLMNKGLCLSVDLTHAIHPNYLEKSEPRHPILMGKGIAIKTSAQHRYASDAESKAKVIDLCNQNEIPYQLFISRGDIPSGTTIGPIYATLTGMATVDIGCPQLSMHSSREIFSCKDHLSMCQLLTIFFL
jgi:aspartyl aminopeptidase